MSELQGPLEIICYCLLIYRWSNCSSEKNDLPIDEHLISEGAKDKTLELSWFSYY